MSADELMAEMREITKKLLGYGARAPKELMLFVKNMMFLNSATAILAPDLDMIQQMMPIYMYFAETHGERIMREVGIDAAQAAPDPDAMKAAFMVDSDVEKLTFRDLQARRDEVRAQAARQRRPTEPSAAAGAGTGERARARAAADAGARRAARRRAHRHGARGRRAARVLGAEDGRAGARLVRRRTVERGRPPGEVPDPRLRRGRPHPGPPVAGRAASTSRTRPRAPGPRDRWCASASTDGPAVLVREYGHERKAAWWVLAPGDDGPLERLGPEPDSDEFAEFILHGDDRRRVHTLLRDQRTVSGVGRGYADDALWRGAALAVRVARVARRRRTGAVARRRPRR